MVSIAYVFLTLCIVLHAAYWLRRFFSKPRFAWNYDKHAILVLIMLLLIAVVNALAAIDQAPVSRFYEALFGQGQVRGIMRLGYAGVYWVLLLLYSLVARHRYPMPQHRELENVKLPAGGLMTICISMVIVILLVGVLFWGTT